MVDRWLDAGVMGVLTRALDGASLRQRVLSDNIANVNTPGFKRSDVTFSGCLDRALGRQPGPSSPPVARLGTSPDRTAWGPQVVTQHHTVGRNDGNNVELELEMTLLSSNALWYQALSRQASETLGRLRMAIHEGRR